MAKKAGTALAAAEQPVLVDELVTEATYEIREITEIRISYTNRTRFNEQALQELAANIKEVGIVQPILIRPVVPTETAPERFEIVAGERRWRATKIAGLTLIPAMIRNLSDRQAAEIQILENIQREDPHPLEEAEGYERLMMNHGYNADQLAEKIKKSRSYIYGRLKLCALALDVREEFLNGAIPASTALLLARIPVPALQTRALSEITKPMGFPAEPMSYRRAQQHIQNNYTLDLTTANFEMDDAKLLAVAGSCIKCPKRSGNQPLLFEDIKSADVCTDPSCFSEKRAAQYAKVIFIANKTGIPVLEGGEAREVRSQMYGSDGEFVFADTSLWRFARNAPATQNQGDAESHIGKENMPKPVKYLKDEDGEVEAIYHRSDIQSALEKAGACETVAEHAARLAQSQKSDVTPTTNKKPTEQEILREKNETLAARETAFRVALYKKLRLRGAGGFSLASLREFVKLLVCGYNDYSIPDDLIGDVYPFETATDEAVCAYIDQASMPEVQLVLVDLVMGECLGVDHYDIQDLEESEHVDTWNALTEMARHEGIDTEQVRLEHELSNSAPEDVKPEDFKAFIEIQPDRLADLTALVMKSQPHNISALQEAATANGYQWTRWELPVPGAAWVKPDGSVADVATTSAEPAAAETPAPAAEEIGSGDYVDANDFKETPEPAKPAVKSKAKVAVPKVLKPAEAWPFPKSAKIDTQKDPA